MAKRRTSDGWARWFAWYPVQLQGRTNYGRIVWLRTIERRRDVSWLGLQFWRYRFIGGGEMD